MHGKRSYLELPRVNILGVDVHAIDMRPALEWVKNAGLQWLHRLAQEPSRLWKRYLVNNPKFVFQITSQIVGLRKV